MPEKTGNNSICDEDMLRKIRRSTADWVMFHRTHKADEWTSQRSNCILHDVERKDLQPTIMVDFQWSGTERYRGTTKYATMGSHEWNMKKRELWVKENDWPVLWKKLQ